MSELKTQSNFEIGKVINQTFKTISRNIVTFGGLAFVLGAAPYAIITLMTAPDIRVLSSGGNASSIMSAAGKIYAIAPFQFLLSLALNSGLVFCAYADMSGRTPTPRDIATTMLRTLFPLLGLFILEGLAVAVGLVLLLIPALMLLSAWAVLTPVLVIEKRGVFGSFSRSAQLTRGARWRVFALLMIYILAVWIISIIGGVLTVGMGSLNVFRPNMAATLSTPYVLLNAVLQAIYAVVTATGATALFVQLRQSREGAPREQILDAFS